jgi:hypothetical protein
VVEQGVPITTVARDPGAGRSAVPGCPEKAAAGEIVDRPGIPTVKPDSKEENRRLRRENAILGGSGKSK